jgi:hypothetical protein
VNGNYDVDAEAFASLFNIGLDSVRKIESMIRSVIELYVIFGLTEPKKWRKVKTGVVQHSAMAIKSQITNHLLYQTVLKVCKIEMENGEGTWAKFFKWKFAAFFAYKMQQDIPKRPDFLKSVNGLWSHMTILGGVAFDFEKHLERGCSHEFTFSIDQLGVSPVSKLFQITKQSFDSFLDTSQQLKKAAPDVPDSMVEKSIADTVLELTGVPKISIAKSIYFGPFQTLKVTDTNRILTNHGSRTFEINKESLVCELQRTVDEIFEHEFISYEDLVEPFFPSTSANYVVSRNNLGSLAVLYDFCSFGKMGDNVLFGQELRPLTQRVAPHYGVLGDQEQRSYNREFEAGIEPPSEEVVIVIDPSPLRTMWEEKYWKIWNLAKEEKPFVEAVGLPEPLKVRVISKGPPLLYTVLKPIQKWLWSTLKKHPVFELIGRYVLEDDINRTLSGLRESDEVVSGDYVASTNRLHGWVSETISDRIMLRLGENLPKKDLEKLPDNYMSDLKRLMKVALTKHIFVVDDKEIPQTEGQLMGSIVSFPILCIANAALCRMALEGASLSGRSRPITYRVTRNGRGRPAPLLVNGDDCLLYGPKQILRECWESICGFAGLESSIGKTYFSSSFCTINSTIFKNNGGVWTEAKYINLGLMKGYKRMGVGTKKGFNPQVGIHQLGVICRELKRTCPVRLWPIVKRRFLYYNMIELSRYPDLPWFVPEWLGGIGLPYDHHEEVHYRDQCAATGIKYQMNDPKWCPVLPKDMPMWNMHQLVMDSLPSKKTCLFKKVCMEEGLEDLEDHWSQFYKLATVNLLGKLPIEELYEVLNDDNSIHRALRHNSRIWGKARRTISAPPMSEEDMAYVQKKVYPPVIVRTDWTRFNCLREEGEEV